MSDLICCQLKSLLNSIKWQNLLMTVAIVSVMASCVMASCKVNLVSKFEVVLHFYANSKNAWNGRTCIFFFFIEQGKKATGRTCMIVDSYTLPCLIGAQLCNISELGDIIEQKPSQGILPYCPLLIP